MRRLGYDWEPVDARLQPAGDGRDGRHKGRYGIIDPQEVAVWGYRMPPKEISPKAEPPRPGAVSSEASKVWAGFVATAANGQPVPDGGCVGEAGRRLTAGRSGPDLAFAERLAGEAYEQAENDSRVRAVFEAWGACMAQRGYTYRTPWDANDDPRWRDDQNLAAAVSTAQADLACRLQVNLVPLWFAVESAYQQRQIDKHGEVLGELRALVDVLYRNAGLVLSGRSPE